MKYTLYGIAFFLCMIVSTANLFYVKGKMSVSCQPAPPAKLQVMT